MNACGSDEAPSNLPAAHDTDTDTDTATVQVSLEIENRYPGDVVIYTRVTDADVPAPPEDADDNDLHDWALEHLFPFTGTGRIHGDAWYDVTVTASSDPRLLHRHFDFGY